MKLDSNINVNQKNLDPKNTISKNVGVYQSSKFKSKTLKKSLIGGTKIKDEVEKEDGEIVVKDVNLNAMDTILNDNFESSQEKSKYLTQYFNHFIASSENDNNQHNALVSILGVELWPPKIYSNSNEEERPHYVIRVDLCENKLRSNFSSSLNTADLEKGSNIFETFCSEMNREIAIKANADSRYIFTVRRDLQSICLFHTELDRLLKELMKYEVQIYLPPFPDAFAIGMIEESFSTEIKGLQMIDPSKFMGGQPYIYNSNKNNSSDKNAQASSIYIQMRACITSIETYLHEVFSLMESIDDHAADFILNFSHLSSNEDDDEEGIEVDDVETSNVAKEGIKPDNWKENHKKGLETFLSGLGSYYI
jgi:hypothetical protein